LREFTFGHARQLESVVRDHLGALCERVELLAGADQRVFIDIDSLLRPVYGHAKKGASYGHTKIAGKQILRKGLSPLITTISTETSAPVIAGARLRAGKTNSGKGAARMIAQAVNTARPAGVRGQVVVRGDSAYGNGVVVAACRRAGARFSLVLTKTRAVTAAIAAIPENAWTPVHYPGAVRDPDTREWISDAEVAETVDAAFGSTGHPVTARLIVRRGQRRPPHRMLCSRCGGITPSSPTPTNPSTKLTSPTAATPSSKPSSPTSSTDPWPICHQDSSAPTRPGSCAQPSRITCYAPLVCWPEALTPWPAGPPCAGASSTSPPDWPAPNADPSCTYPATGPGPNPGLRCGTK
jgi:Transposase DDE domain group 1